jgi:hypothetical protein
MFLHLSSMSVLTALRRCFVPAAAALWMSVHDYWARFIAALHSYEPRRPLFPSATGFANEWERGCRT